MKQNHKRQSANLDLSGVVKDLLEDGIITQSDAAEITSICHRDSGSLHPLEIVACQTATPQSRAKTANTGSVN